MDAMSRSPDVIVDDVSVGESTGRPTIKNKMTSGSLAPPSGTSSCGSNSSSSNSGAGDFRLQADYNWSRSLSERVRGMRDSALSIVWKKRREQKLREIEARDACHWLLAAGFPQYVQLYEEHQCPIDLRQVELDHSNIEKIHLSTIFRRIDVLNRLTCCKATETVVHLKFADCDDDDHCLALSDKWRFVCDCDLAGTAGRWIHVDQDDSGTASPKLVNSSPPNSVYDVQKEEATPDDDSAADTTAAENNNASRNMALFNGMFPKNDPMLKDGRAVVTNGDENGSKQLVADYRAYFSFDGLRRSLRRGRDSSREKSPAVVVKRPASTASALVGGEFVRSGSGRFSLRGARSILRRGVDSIIGRRGANSGGSDLTVSSTTSTSRRQSGGAAVRPEIGKPVAPTSAEFCEKMERLGCVDVRTLTSVDDAGDPSARNCVSGRIQSTGSSIGGSTSMPRAMSSDSLVGILQRLALVTDCSMAVPLKLELASDCGSVANDNGDIIRVKVLPPRLNGFYDDASPDGDTDHRVSIDALDCSRSQTAAGCGCNRPLPDVVIDARVAAASDVADNDLAVWSRYFDVFFCDCRLPPEIGSFRNGSWSSTSPWWWGTLCQSQSFGAATDAMVAASSDVIENERLAVNGQNELDRILCELDKDIILLDQTLDASTSSTMDWNDRQSLNDNTSHSSSVPVTSSSANYAWQFTRPSPQPTLTAEQPEADAMCNDVMMTTMQTADVDESQETEEGPESVIERRDSGVGFSLTRRPSDKKKQRSSNSYFRSLKCTSDCCERHPGHMSSGQLTLLRKLSLLHVTSTMETYSPLHQSGCSWTAPRQTCITTNQVRGTNSARTRRPNVFGAPLGLSSVGRPSAAGGGGGTASRRHELTPPNSRSSERAAAVGLPSSQSTAASAGVEVTTPCPLPGSLPLPTCMLRAMRFLLTGSASDAVGIFRKSGVRSRIQKLRDDIEADPDYDDFNSQPVYDVADVLKLYFHELPECLLTEKLSETCIAIFTYVPEDMRMAALKSTLALLPDENRDALYCLLSFLNRLSEFASFHQMTASNLAICFAPSLFHIYGLRTPSTAGPRGASPRRDNKHSSQGSGSGLPDESDMADQKAAHDCLTAMITHLSEFFTVSEDVLTVHCRMSNCQLVNRPLNDTFVDLPQQKTVNYLAKYQSRIDSCFRDAYKESNDNSWLPVSLNASNSGVELSYKMATEVTSFAPRRIWRCRTEVNCASAPEVLARLLEGRHLWDDEVARWRIVERLDGSADIFHYVTSSSYDVSNWGLAYHRAAIDFCELRSWRCDNECGTYTLVSFSVDHPSAKPTAGTIRGFTVNSCFFIEARGPKRCQLTFVSRLDTRGRSLEWYRRFHGLVCAHKVNQLSRSFSTIGPNATRPVTETIIR